MKYVIVGTAGHVDHGKSTLVKALTGTDPDRWEEEKRRGITIDLGFAELDLGGDVHAGFVDVPGHERFVKNMLAGAGGIDLVLLVIAADESIKPQTREHFEICRLLGIERGVIALTKSDLVERDVLDLVTLEIHDFVAGSFLEKAPIVPVSATTREGLDLLLAELRRVGLEAPAKPADLPFRLPIDRSFVIKGFGTVVTGTLITGRIEAEQEIEIYPHGLRARVRGIQVHNRVSGTAWAGQRTALNLAGVEAQELERGMMLAPPGLFAATSCLDAALELLPSSRPLKNRARVHFHGWTAEVVAEVVLLDRKELAPGERGYAQLRLAGPGLFLPGDRFILRQFSPVVTIAGGVILDSNPPRHRVGDEHGVRALQLLNEGGPEEQIKHHVRREGEISLAALVARTGIEPGAVVRMAGHLTAAGRVRTLGHPPTALVDEDHYQKLLKAVESNLERFHKSNPLVAGISREEIRAGLAARRGREVVLPSVPLITSLLQDLAASGRAVIKGDLVRLAGRGIEMTQEEATAKEQIEKAFEKAGLAVPNAQEVLGQLRVDRVRADKLLKILLKEGTLVRVTEDLVFHSSSLAALREMVKRRKAQNNRIDVGIFKELTGLTRKYAIPLLEYLDRERVTRRAGNERIIL